LTKKAWHQKRYDAIHYKVLNYFEKKRVVQATYEEIAKDLKIDRETVARHIKDELNNEKTRRITKEKGIYIWGIPQEFIDGYIDWNNFKEALNDPEVWKAVSDWTIKKLKEDLENPEHQFDREKGTQKIPIINYKIIDPWIISLKGDEKEEAMKALSALENIFPKEIISKPLP